MNQDIFFEDAKKIANEMDYEDAKKICTEATLISNIGDIKDVKIFAAALQRLSDEDKIIRIIIDRLGKVIKENVQGNELNA